MSTNKNKLINYLHENNNIQYNKYNVLTKRPKVLLIGNGLVHANQKTSSWSDIIIKMANNNDINDYSSYNIPYPILSLLVTDDNDNTRYDNYQKYFKTDKTKNALIDKLIEIPFDAILTTNYTYEIEIAHQMYFLHNPECFRVSPFEKNNNKYFLHSFYSFNNSTPIWHIHGELQYKKSIIFRHDEYIKLIGEITKHFSSIKYLDNYLKHNENIPFTSWIDYFIFGDLYIIGQGFDYSEIDLWWLLCKRNSILHSIGITNSKAFIFEPFHDNSNNHKIVFLNHFFQVINGFNDNKIIHNNNQQDYFNFYRYYIKQIRNNI